MDADVKGAYAQLNKSWKTFTHNGMRMSKQEVKAVLEYAIEKGYETTMQIPNREIDKVILNL